MIGSAGRLTRSSSEHSVRQGITAPPVRIEDLLDHLRIHRDFYNLQDQTLLQRFWHKVRV